jgi:hypothetical protein
MAHAEISDAVDALEKLVPEAYRASPPGTTSIVTIPQAPLIVSSCS